jgi:hypothetical protein
MNSEAVLQIVVPLPNIFFANIDPIHGALALFQIIFPLSLKKIA